MDEEFYCVVCHRDHKITDGYEGMGIMCECGAVYKLKKGNIPPTVNVVWKEHNNE